MIGFRTWSVSHGRLLYRTTRLLYPITMQQGDPKSTSAVQPAAGCLLELLLCCSLRVLMSQQRLLVCCARSGTRLAQPGDTFQVPHEPERLWSNQGVGEGRGENATPWGTRAAHLISHGFLSSPGCGVIKLEMKEQRHSQRPWGTTPG